ncbi:MAG: hypothetical protein GY804_15600 [Alphaproteobacteria bacterium]|nr:hypothetical protein [Alphaproteobacteria bacterium]
MGKNKRQTLAFNATLMLVKTLLFAWLFGAVYTALDTNTQGAECSVVDGGWFAAFYDGASCRFITEFYSMFLVFRCCREGYSIILV